MGNPAYLVTNLFDSTTNLTSSTEDTVYVLENLYNQIPAKPFKFTVTTGGWIEGDIGSAQSATCLVLANHNLTSGATVTLYGGNSPNPSNNLGSFTYREFDMRLTFSSVSYRYWRIVISDTNTDNVQVGEAVLGVHTVLTPSMAYGFSDATDWGKYGYETEMGVVHVYDKFDRELRDYKFEPLRDSDIAELTTLDRLVRGSSVPFSLMPDVESGEVLYGRKQSIHVRKNVSNNLWTATMKFVQEVRGVEVT